MSLLLHKRAIARAVLGELPAPAEARLRQHLGRCARCRSHYDGLARTSEALGRGRAAAVRERERLFAALGPSPAAAPPAAADVRRRRRVWLGASLALVPAAAIAILLLSSESDQITLRGGAPAAPRAPATVVLYASRKTGPATHGPVRLVGELPGSGEARVAMDDYLQLGLRGLRAPTHVRVSGIDERGRVHDYVGDTVVTPGTDPLTLGGSVELGREHAPGRLRLVALFAERTIDDEALRAAIARLDRRRTDRGTEGGGADLVTGLVVIEK